MQNKKDAKETLKNTGLVGGSQFINIVIGIFKTKIVAILLGPSGIGIIQLLSSSLSLVGQISGFGLGFSGVREISESIGEKDLYKTAKIVKTLKGWVYITGLLGMIISLIMSKQLSRWAFGDDTYWLEISILSTTIILNNVSSSYSAIIRGTRNIADFAKINVLSSLFTTTLAVPVYYFYNLNGIVAVLILTSLIPLILNVIYVKKIKLPKVTLTLKEGFFGGLGMAQLGLFTVLTGVLTEATLYYVRIAISTKLGVAYVGFYAVATTLAVNYMGLIFTAMATDYFPKLSAINKDNEAINGAVVLQTKIVLLLGTPLILGMYTFSEVIIEILYSKEFVRALPLLMWMLLSVFLRLIGFPIGYVFLAKGRKGIFVFTQSLWNLLFFIFVLISWKFKGDLEGIGMAFTGAYSIGVLVNVFIIKRVTGLKYDKTSLKYMFLFLTITLIYFCVSIFFNGWDIFLIKGIGVLLLFIFCIKQLEELININVIKLLQSKFKKK